MYDYPKIHEAAFRGDIETVKQLLEQGISIETLCSLSATCLFSAVTENQLEMVQFLLERGANVNHQITRKMIGNIIIGGRTPLRGAVHSASIAVVELLLKWGADASLCDDEGITALDSAMRLAQNNPNANRPIDCFPEKVKILQSHLSHVANL